MSTASRKARKRAGEPFEATPKEPTGSFVTNVQRRAKRRADRRAAASLQSFVDALLAERRGEW